MGTFVRDPLCDPTDLQGDAESLAYRRMSAKESLSYFNVVSLDCNILKGNVIVMFKKNIQQCFFI
jgi:hypothetical protein